MLINQWKNRKMAKRLEEAPDKGGNVNCQLTYKKVLTSLATREM